MVLPNPFRRRCLIVSGSPRSGTSWLGKGLSFSPGFTYYREPDNPNEVNAADDRFAWAYLTPEIQDPEYLDLMDRATRGELATAFTMCDDPGPILQRFGQRGLILGQRHPVLFLRKRHVLLKLVYASLNLSWLAARFPQARLVTVFRHPCGQFESWRRLGWEPEPVRLLENERLMRDHLHPFESLLGGAKSFWERAGAYWGALAYVNHRQTEAEGGRLVVAYEWLCEDPVARFRTLYRRLGLRWSRNAERFLRAADRAGDTGAYSLNRSAAAQIDGWKRRLAAEEIAACRRFVEPFEVPYYPNFEPRTMRFRRDGWSDTTARISANSRVAAVSGWLSAAAGAIADRQLLL